MKLFKPIILSDSIEIKTTPEKIWEFFTNLERNYKAWHPKDHIVFKYSFPISLVAPWFEWSIEPKSSISVFTARSYLRAGEFYLRYFKKEMEFKLEIHHQHVKEEGENLKKILESFYPIDLEVER